jgi:hypothetical protein
MFQEKSVQQEMDQQPAAPQPKLATVVSMLIAAALIGSYLWAYAITNALVASDVISRWPPGHDPRPLRMGIGFVVMMCFFTAIAGVSQWMSQRQLRRIDEMEQAEEELKD